jgi:DNA-directed RNA polymerase specialized sigma24 family protein/multidrug transporter EmrE-like cation transporter
LITGKTGTGKSTLLDVFAQRARGAGRGQPLPGVTCSAIHPQTVATGRTGFPEGGLPEAERTRSESGRAVDRKSARAMILPLALAQFICSYAATNMNVAISAIANDLGTTVAGVQTAITMFTLTMAALMIPGSKLTDIWGRKRCFVLGLFIYGAGGLLALLAFGLPQLIVGYSLLEGIGSALLAWLEATVFPEEARFSDPAFAYSSGLMLRTVASTAAKMHRFTSSCEIAWWLSPASGSFKSWLLNLTRWRIHDQLRKRGLQKEAHRPTQQDGTRTSTIERVADPNSEALEQEWNQEWEKNLIGAALGRVKGRVKPELYQIFDLLAVKHWPAMKVSQRLKVNLAQVYYAKYKVSALLKREIKRLEQKGI